MAPTSVAEPLAVAASTNRFPLLRRRLQDLKGDYGDGAALDCFKVDFPDFVSDNNHKLQTLVGRISGHELARCFGCSGVCWEPGDENGDPMCPLCDRRYGRGCYQCSVRCFSDNMYYWPEMDNHVCDGCWDKLEECEYCGNMMDPEGDHRCKAKGCECLAPNPSFEFPNDGNPPAKSDHRIVVPMPAGMISLDGLEAIKTMFRSINGPEMEARYCISALSPEWVVTKGPLTGTYPKRLARVCYKSLRLKISPATLGKVGSIAQAHTESEVAYHIEVTRDVADRDAWVYGSSCWWGDYSDSRCMLKQIGGLGVRGFKDDDPFCRAWVLPLIRRPDMNWTPEHDPMKADAFVVFNGYVESRYLGNHPDGYTLSMARLVAHMASKSYQKINFQCPPMYVNDDIGYLIAEQSMLEKVSAITILETLNH